MATAVDFTYRVAQPADATAIGRVVAAAFEDYRSFAPPDWEPPGADVEAAYLTTLLSDPEFWCLLAERDGRVAGHAALVPARSALVPSEEGDLAHLRALFVEPQWWGCGLAGSLHSRALDEAAARGFKAIRLFTPVGQARARRFYEREGWRAVGEPFVAPLGIELIEYRRELGR